MRIEGALVTAPRGAVVAVIGAWTVALHVVQLLLVAATGIAAHLAPIVVSLVLWVGVTAWGSLPRRMRRSEAAAALGAGAAAITANALWSATPGVPQLVSVGLMGYVLAVGTLSGGAPALLAYVVVLGCQAAVVGAVVGPTAFGAYAVASTCVTTAAACLATWTVQRNLRTTLGRAREASVRDPLTGLLNRRGMAERFPHLRAAAPAGHRIAAVVLDLDHFKRINDAHGHDVGDRVLVAVADVLRARARRDDVVVRLGGEELAWLGAWPSPQDALSAAEGLLRAIAAAPLPADLSTTASAGVAFSTDATHASPDAEALWRLVVRADSALYEAKAAGRARALLAAARLTDGSDPHHAGAPALQVQDGGSEVGSAASAAAPRAGQRA